MPRAASRGRGRGRGRGRRSTAPGPESEFGCVENRSLDGATAALPAYFLRHWPPQSVSFEAAQRTYENLASWGRTRFQIVGGKLYYPNLKHNTFGCVLRRTPILAWALLETLDRYPTLPDVDVPVNW